MNEHKVIASSQKWWLSVRESPELLRSWLLRQYRGEVSASTRIGQLREQFTQPNSKADRILATIVEQEQQHAEWVKQLLLNRDIQPALLGDPSARYWKSTLPMVQDFATGCAVGAHAEQMRLYRIEVIASDTTAPDDIRTTFANILPDERFHARAFRSLAGEQAMQTTAPSHLQGLRLLGLSP